MNYLQAYLQRVKDKGNNALAEAIEKTANEISSEYIATFSFTEHVVSLLVGEVQSGKTSHLFGVICIAADEGFTNFVLLTTDNNLLQQQTLQRAEQDLCDFCVCGENDYIKFSQNSEQKPALIVLKKNARVLSQWKNNFASQNKLYSGKPLFIVDDEADAASLNTQVNKHQQSTINKRLEEIKETTASCSIYLEVTGTPQAIFLQTVKSGWKPYFLYYFQPGKGYLGGDFFFPPDKPSHIIFTDNEEASDLLSEEEFPENGLKTALLNHLIVSSHIMLQGGDVSNFLIHPSMKTEYHQIFAEKIGNYLNEILHSNKNSETKNAFLTAYQELKQSKSDIMPFEEIYDYIISVIENDKIAILTLNSISPFIEREKYEKGINIIIGGNSLGRGVTFPKLQTIYYCRLAKNPQADTMWQHARMFGYDRDPALIRVFMPPKLYKIFSDINNTNRSIVAQLIKTGDRQSVKFSYPRGINPTRKNVIDKNIIESYCGGVNYFPLYPTNKNISNLDILLQDFENEVYSVSLKLIAKILEETDSEESDWNGEAFVGIVQSILAENKAAHGKLIVRRNRDIGKGTGTLLSPNDRLIGEKITDSLVLTMYKIIGRKEKGWNGTPLWIPNIKLPGERIYYSGD